MDEEAHGHEHDGGQEHGHDHEPEPHRHGADRAEIRLGFSRRHGRRLLAVNFVASEERTAEAEIEAGYSVGLRSSLRPGLAWGLEGQGQLERHGAHQALLALYADVAERLTVHAGLGVGLGDDAPDFTVRTALVWRWR